MTSPNMTNSELLPAFDEWDENEALSEEMDALTTSRNTGSALCAR
jgi:hypothetical protein